MTKILALIIPLIFFGSFAFALFRKVRVYDSFADGVKGVLPLIISVFPYIAAITMLSKLMEVSGLSAAMAKWLAPAFDFLGVPKEIAPLILIKPLSGSGGIAVLSDILEIYGVDSYISRCACVVYGSSETIFYVGAVYFAGLKRKKLNAAVCIAVISYLASVVFACFLCKIM
ncbi:MAG: spore maturation protein [Clostridia bacterium]|nr:spore maturation protein [Clostridia bacterium]